MSYPPRFKSQLLLLLRLVLGWLILNTHLKLDGAEVRSLTLSHCLETALANNRLLQIERLNPLIAYAILDGAYGYFDPIFLTDVRRESLSDSGGFDPADFSKDAVYSAQSHVAELGLTGVLPSGMIYTLSGEYAHSFGQRNGLNFDSYNLYAGISVQQPLLKNFWIDEGRLTIKLSKKNLLITELGARFVTMDIVNQVQQAYYGLQGAIESVKVQERLQQTRRTFLEGVRRQVRGGTLTALDERVAEAQLATVDADLISVHNAVVLAEHLLLSLMGDKFTNQARIPLVPAEGLLCLPETPDRAASAQHALAHRPDLAQLRQEVEKAGLDLKYRRNQLFPALDLVAGYGRRGASVHQVPPFFPASASMSAAFDQIGRGENPSDMIGVIFSMPLTRAAERAGYAASKHLKAQAELRVKEKEEAVLREIADAVDTVRSGWDRVAATRRAAEAALAALRAEERKLAGGQSTIIFVLQLQANLARAEAAEVLARTEYNNARSQFHFVEGTLLERHRISVENR